MSRQRAPIAKPSAAWRHARSQLIYWLMRGILPAYGEMLDGTKVRIKEQHLTTPYFQLNVSRSSFLLNPPDEWESIWIDGPALRRKVLGIRKLQPRKTKFEWQEITNKAWEIALESDPPRIVEALSARLDEWYLTERGEGEASPDGRELKDLMRHVVSHLGERRLI